MSNRSTLQVASFVDIEKGLLRAHLLARKVAEFALWEAAAALKKDADEIPPKTPHLHGNLRGDSIRGVKAKGQGKTEKDWWPKVEKEDLGMMVLAILVTYCAPYAARWHEATEDINWSEDGVGSKWLEAKIAREDLRNKYYALIAQRIKEGLENA